MCAWRIGLAAVAIEPPALFWKVSEPRTTSSRAVLSIVAEFKKQRLPFT